MKLLNVGESKRNEKLDVAEFAAWTAVASVILNLDIMDGADIPIKYFFIVVITYLHNPIIKFKCSAMIRALFWRNNRIQHRLHSMI